MIFVTGWRYWYRRYLGWFPVQPCIACWRWYWGGLPWPEFGGGGVWWWNAWMKEYCSKKCHDEAEY